MRETLTSADFRKLRVGAVAYLNARPLIVSLGDFLPATAELVIDHPSRLADGLRDGRFDVAMIPSIEYVRGAGYSIVSDACIACDGAVRSVKLYGRKPVEQVRTLALDEGSRTSAVLARILLTERFGVEPRIESLPIGAALRSSTADAVLLIGDRGLSPADGAFEFEWDLGEEWTRWTGLPFVFAMWIARSGANSAVLSASLAAARDDGIKRFEEIARHAAGDLGLSEADCLAYLRDHLEFRLGQRQRHGLEQFFELASRHGFAPRGAV
jgi:chorismate dehydratase